VFLTEEGYDTVSEAEYPPDTALEPHHLGATAARRRRRWRRKIAERPKVAARREDADYSSIKKDKENGEAT
jgi:hypothetical protein